MQDEQSNWMQLCLALGHKALKNGNPPVGSVIVRNGEVIGRGQEAGKSKGDITCHAEIEAIREAVQLTGESNLSDCILYTTHEPCLMCSYVIRHHRISQVVFGLEVPHIGGYSSAWPLLTATDIPIWGPSPRIVGGIEKEACQQLSLQYQNILPKQS